MSILTKNINEVAVSFIYGGYYYESYISLNDGSSLRDFVNHRFFTKKVKKEISCNVINMFENAKHIKTNNGVDSCRLLIVSCSDLDTTIGTCDIIRKSANSIQDINDKIMLSEVV